MSEWTDHVDRWKDCTKCPLGHQRDRICLARGQVPSDVVFVGEAPGASEDATGLPFWGPAGDLLQQIVDRALPAEVRHAFTNLVACFPREAKGRGDNEPEHEEIMACRPRLVEFVNLCRPRLVVCVGVLAERYLPRNDTPTVGIVHPAAILRRMPLVQKNMAVQKSIVVVRCAVQRMLESDYTFTKWGTDADSKQGWHSDADIPF